VAVRIGLLRVAAKEGLKPLFAGPRFAARHAPSHCRRPPSPAAFKLRGMKDLEEATEKICELKGDLLALDVVLASLTQILAPEVRAQWLRSLDASAEFAATVLMNTVVAECTVDAYTREVARWRKLLTGQGAMCQSAQQPQGLAAGGRM